MILSIVERILNRGGWITSNEVRKPYSGSEKKKKRNEVIHV